MQVLFIQNLKGIAYKGEIKNVKDGYFQNYLLPHKLAVLATAARIKGAEEMKKKMVIGKERLVSEAKDIKSKLDGMVISMKRKTHNDGLYASITQKDIIEEILKKANVKLEKEHLVLPSAIKKTGSFEVPVDLTEGVKFKVLLEIKGEE